MFELFVARRYLHARRKQVMILVIPVIGIAAGAAFSIAKLFS